MLLFIFTNWDLIFTNTSFNTSHVTLYRFRKIFHKRKSQFQYISCYSLSIVLHCLQFRIPRFNTSHVTLYLRCSWFWINLNVVSIHLMLLFINDKGKFNGSKKQFQYISCYSLSLQAAPLSSEYPCFNTSHVTLYLLIPESPVFVRSFQYISCYSLSLFCSGAPYLAVVSIHLMLLFIGIKSRSVPTA